MTDTPNRPEWWSDYQGYADSQEVQHEGQDALIHEDGFGAGWTLGYEAGRESMAEAVAALRAHVNDWGHVIQCGYFKGLIACSEICQQTRAAIAKAEGRGA